MQPNDIVYLGVVPVRIDILTNADGIDTREVMASLAMATQLASVPPRLPLLSETSLSIESTLSLWANTQPCRMVTMHRKIRVLCG